MNFAIGEVNRATPHLYADLAELLLFVGVEGVDRLHKNQLMALSATSSLSLDELDDEESEEKAAADDAQRHDRIEAQLESVWLQLEYRERALGELYPFRVEGDFLVRCSELTIGQRVYRLLLACSRLRSFKARGIPQKWAKAFTFICQYALRGLVPGHSTVRVFDANSPDRKNHYGTDLRQALRKLGTDLRVLSINEVECDRESASGDAGLDLVATIDFDDGAASAYAVMGQCGAQETKWPTKTLEAHASRFRNFYQSLFHWPAVMFTPVFYRTATGEWVNNQDASDILLADRFRILKLLGWSDAWPSIAHEQWFTEFEAEFAMVVIK